MNTDSDKLKQLEEHIEKLQARVDSQEKELELRYKVQDVLLASGIVSKDTLKQIENCGACMFPFRKEPYFVIEEIENPWLPLLEEPVTRWFDEFRNMTRDEYMQMFQGTWIPEKEQ